MIVDEKEYLAHYGILRRSGRYPWGSSNNEVIRSKGFLDYIQDLKDQGLKDIEIARGIGMSTTDFRATKSIAKNAVKQADIAFAQRLQTKGWSTTAIAKRMEKPESSVRALLAPGAAAKANIVRSIADMFKEQVAEKKYIDVGSGVENHLGITDNRKKLALAMLKQEGYKVQYLKIQQLGTGKYTTMIVLTAPETTYSELFKNRADVQQIMAYSTDKGRSFNTPQRPITIDPRRVVVNYKETGGDKLDGVIYVRPNVKDLSLGESRYAQVRVLVGDGHYLKGMAIYSTDLPDGVDLMFNTNKSKANTPTDFDAMKEVSGDPDSPFGANIKRQIMEKDEDGNPIVTSAMNIVNEEGTWQNWSRSLSSQVLSKQSPSLARTQLNMLSDNKQREFKEIMSLTNPAIRKKLLETFADGVDSSAVDLEAASLTKNSRHHVILPVSSMPPNQIYAPNYNDGDKVVLIRHPHGGTFEIPELIVNNNHPEAKRILGDARDAVGIHHSVAERLSGADFDGDTVIVIPDKEGKIRTTAALDGLKDFDPVSEYPGYDGMPKINKQQEMGNVSNLITDMTIKGAAPDEIARAVRHSMVVIDAEKHNLNWKLSSIQNGIPALKTKYQGGPRAGASTLISRAGSEQRVLDRRDRRATEGGPIDPVTGEKRYTETGDSYVDRNGNTIYKKLKSKKLAETNDARTLITGTGTPIERVYATHSNKLKSLANAARLEILNTPNVKYSPSAATTYAQEVASLRNHLDLAKRNRPLERQAQLIARTVYDAKRAANPSMDDDSLKRERFKALANARNRTGASQHKIQISPNEWDAIQAGAISNSMLEDILDKADLELVRQLATPKRRQVVTPAKLARAQTMMAQGYTRAEIAQRLGIALGTLDEALYGGGN